MAAKPFPDFTSAEFRKTGARGKLYALREYVLTREGPVPPAEVKRLCAELLRISADAASRGERIDRWSGDFADERLFREFLAALE